MVKAYLRYEHDAALGVVTSAPAVAFLADGRVLATAALESVALTDARTGTVVATLTPPVTSTGVPPREVTSLASAPPRTPLLAAGHADGRVRLWDVDGRTCDACLTGHASTVTALAWDGDGGALASGGADTDIVLWDAAAAAGTARLRGHTAPVTGLAFIGAVTGASLADDGDDDASTTTTIPPPSTTLASVSRDGTVRVWHLPARACVQTVAGLTAGGGGGELWCASLAPGGSMLAVAGTGADVVLLRVGLAHKAGGITGAAAGAAPLTLTHAGTLRRAAPDRAAALAWTRGRDGRPLLAAASAGRVVDFWRARGADEVRRHAVRRAKRKRDKKGGEGGGGGGDDAATAAAQLITIDAADELEPLPPLRLKHRVRGATWCPSRLRGRRGGGGGGALARLALALATNVVEQWDIAGPKATADDDDATATPPRTLRHRSGQRPPHRRARGRPCPRRAHRARGRGRRRHPVERRHPHPPPHHRRGWRRPGRHVGARGAARGHWWQGW